VTDREDEMELVRGSGNVFADFGVPDAELRQFRASLAAEIIKTLDAQALSVREAETRIRQVKLERFTVDRLMRMLDRLNCDVRVKLSVAPRVRSSGQPLSPLAA
jgi:predicted XRE-type DNA-binding protein